MSLLKDLVQYRNEQEWPEPYNNDSIPDTYGISLREGQTMYELVRHFKPEVLLELGTNRGNALWFMAKAMERNGFGTIFTVDVQDFTEHRAKEFPFVHFFQQDAIEYLKTHEDVLAITDFFSHDDSHDFSHIMEELKIVERFQPKVMTIHDAQTESKQAWDTILKDEKIIPDYERHTVESLMGIGILVNKNKKQHATSQPTHKETGTDSA